MPEISQFLKTSIEVTDPALPIFYENDSLLNEGFLVLVDPDRLKCWPSQANATNGQTLKNLVDGGVDSTIIAPVLGTFREKGFEFTARSATNYIRVASIGELDLGAMGSPDMAYILWVKREANFSTDDYQTLFGIGTAANVATSYLVYIRIQTGGQGLQFGVSNGTTSKVLNLSGQHLTDFNGSLVGSTVQIVCAVEDGVLKIFMNGAQNVGAVVTAPAKPYVTPANSLWRTHSGMSGTGFKGVIKRFGAAKLGYGKTAAEIAAEDWAANHVRENLP